MIRRSVYTLTCAACGAAITTEHTVGRCPACGVEYRIEWAARYERKGK